MALFTKLFERDHNPYDLKGRWYRFHIVNDNLVMDNDAVVTNAHINRSTSGSNPMRDAILIEDGVSVALDNCIIPMVTPSAAVGTSGNHIVGSNNTTLLTERLHCMGTFHTSANAAGVGILPVNVCSDYYVYVYCVKR